jgi:hypothetical protein
MNGEADEVVEFSQVAGGVPVHYDRTSAAEYGTRGRPATLRCGPGFARKLDAMFFDLWGIAGRAEVVTSAGAFVDKPGLHGQGRAFDLDAVFWAERSMVTRRDGYAGHDRRRDFGVEAVLRKHFGTVLDYHFNADHRDHFHVDDGTGVGFRSGSRSTVLFVQAALNEFYTAGLAVDGVYGPRTRAALDDVAGNVTAPAEWLAFLDTLARKGL